MRKLAALILLAMLLPGCADDPPEDTLQLFLEAVVQEDGEAIAKYASPQLEALLQKHKRAGEWPDISIYSVACRRMRNTASCRFCCLNNKFLFRYQGEEFYFTDRLVMERLEGKWIVTGNK